MTCFILFPRSLKKASASCPKTSEVPMAMGMKWWVEEREEYFVAFLFSASLATMPASEVANTE